MGRRSLPQFFKMNVPCLARQFQGVINGAQSKSISFFVAQYCTDFQSKLSPLRGQGTFQACLRNLRKAWDWRSVVQGLNPSVANWVYLGSQPPSLSFSCFIKKKRSAVCKSCRTFQHSSAGSMKSLSKLKWSQFTSVCFC